MKHGDIYEDMQKSGYGKFEFDMRMEKAGSPEVTRSTSIFLHDTDPFRVLDHLSQILLNVKGS